jgi:DNA-binding MarR family transcriptional regulator
MSAAVQAGLFDQPAPEFARARRTDPKTSKAAARTVPVVDLEARVLAALRSNGGMTTRELAALLNVELVSVSPRMRPLVEKGLVVDSGERRSGPGRRSKAIVWRARGAA